MRALKLRRLLAVLLLPFLIALCASRGEANAESSIETMNPEDDAFFAKLKTHDFRVLSPNECRIQYQKAKLSEEEQQKWMEESMEEGLTSPIRPWTPLGTRHRAVRPQCSAVRLEALMIANRKSPAVQSNTIRDFFSACKAELTRFAPPDWYSLLSLGSVRVEMCDHPRIRKVFLRLPDGNIVRGYLGMKPGELRRPLVIVKCGVFCNAGDSSHRVQLMHLFDEGPFNVLALANITGSDYASDNEHLAVGGFDEGMQMLHLAKSVKQGPLGRYVSSIHFSGVSLGGQAGLFASYLNKYNYQNDRSPYIGSVLAMCPVVELKPSVEGLFVKGIKGRLARMVFVRQLVSVFASVPILGQLFPGLKDAPNETMPDYVADGALHYYKTYKKEWVLPPFTNRRFETRDDLWNHNSFLKLADGVFETPTLVFASDDDWIVGTDANARPLAEKIRRPSDNGLQVVTVDRGNHCAFNRVYGWDVASSLARSYFVSNSPELLNRRRERTIPIPANIFPRRPIAWKSEDHLSQDFKAAPGKDYVKLNFRVWKGPFEDKIDCWSRTMYDGDEQCIRFEVVKVPYAAFGAEWARSPRNQAEADALTRWLNANIRVVDDAGAILHGGHAKPAHFKWIDYDAEPAAADRTDGPDPFPRRES